MPSTDTDTDTTVRRILCLLIVMFSLQVFMTCQLQGVKTAIEQMKEIMPSQSTDVPIVVQGTATTTKVTTTFREAPHTSETDAEWDARHIATCARIKAAWANAGS